MRGNLNASTISRREGSADRARRGPVRAVCTPKRSPSPGTTKDFQLSSIQLLVRLCKLHELASLGSLLHGVEATQRLDVIGRRDHRSLLATHDMNKVSSPPN